MAPCHDSFADWSKLPLHLLEEIFTHLPFVQVFRFRLVCKQWLRLLSHAAFMKRSLAVQKASSQCVIVSACPHGGDSLVSGFDPQSGRWQAMPPIPADLGFPMASANGVLVSRSRRDGCLCVHNPLLQLYRMLPRCGAEDEDAELGKYVRLVVGADTSSFKVFWFFFFDQGWKVVPCTVPDKREDSLVPLKNGFCKVHIYDSRSDSWTRLPNDRAASVSRSEPTYHSPLKGPCTDGSGVFWFEVRERPASGGFVPAHRVLSHPLVTFDTNQGVWKEQLKPPMEEGAGRGTNFVVEHLVNCGSEYLFLRTTTSRISTVGNLLCLIILHFYRFDGLTDKWVTVHRTTIKLGGYRFESSDFLLEMVLGRHVVWKDKVVWFSKDLGKVIAFDMTDGKWTHHARSENCHHRHQTNIIRFPFAPSVIKLPGMASALSFVTVDT